MQEQAIVPLLSKVSNWILPHQERLQIIHTNLIEWLVDDTITLIGQYAKEHQLLIIRQNHDGCFHLSGTSMVLYNPQQQDTWKVYDDLKSWPHKKDPYYPIVFAGIGSHTLISGYPQQSLVSNTLELSIHVFNLHTGCVEATKIPFSSFEIERHRSTLDNLLHFVDVTSNDGRYYLSYDVMKKEAIYIVKALGKGAILMNAFENGRLFGSNTRLNTLSFGEYNTKMSDWSSRSPPLFPIKYGMAIVVFQNHIYICDDEEHHPCQQYDMMNDKWTWFPSLRLPSLCVFAHTLGTVLDQTLYLVITTFPANACHKVLCSYDLSLSPSSSSSYWKLVHTFPPAESRHCYDLFAIPVM